MGNVRCSS